VTSAPGLSAKSALIGLFVALALITGLTGVVGCQGDTETTDQSTPDTAEEAPAEAVSTTEADFEDRAALVEQARDLVEQLAQGEYARAYASFDQQMQTAIPEEQLGGLWKSLEQQLGDYQEILDTRTSVEQGFRVVYVVSQFRDSPIDVKVVFGPEGRVSGLFFLPVGGDVSRSQEGPGYYPADYVRESSFSEEEVTVGAPDWPLPGTLTLPEGEGPFPGVVLVHGSGPSDRNETVGPNRPFQDLAWGLASHGIAVLRYEKRTKEHAQRVTEEEDFGVDEETVDDAVSALELLETREQIDGDRVYVLGHSLGAFLAPRIAVQAAEVGVEPDGLILLAPPARPLEDLIYDQSLYLAELDGEVSAAEQAQLDELEQQIEAVREGGEALEAGELPLGVPASYWRSLEGYDPIAVAEELEQPILALFGERDYQVTEQDESAWREAFADEDRVYIEQLANLNHLFMAGSGPPSPAEYEEADNVDLLVIQRVSAWVQALR